MLVLQAQLMCLEAALLQHLRFLCVREVLIQSNFSPDLGVHTQLFWPNDAHTLQLHLDLQSTVGGQPAATERGHTTVGGGSRVEQGQRSKASATPS